jgi:hypothetical protein
MHQKRGNQKIFTSNSHYLEIISFPLISYSGRATNLPRTIKAY